MLSFLNPWLILGALAALAASFGAGMYQHSRMDRAALVGAMVTAAEETKVLAEKSAAKEAEYLSKLRQSEGKANAALRKLRSALDTVPACPVPDTIIGMLNESISGGEPAAAARVPDAAAARIAPDPAETTTCRDVIENASENFSLVCRPNAEQLFNLQGWVRDFCR